MRSSTLFTTTAGLAMMMSGCLKKDPEWRIHTLKDVVWDQIWELVIEWNLDDGSPFSIGLTANKDGTLEGISLWIMEKGAWTTVGDKNADGIPDFEETHVGDPFYTSTIKTKNRLYDQIAWAAKENGKVWYSYALSTRKE